MEFHTFIDVCCQNNAFFNHCASIWDPFLIRLKISDFLSPLDSDLGRKWSFEDVFKLAKLLFSLIKSGGFSHSISFKNWLKNQFFVKTTYLEWPRNHSEHPIWSGIKFPVYRDPQTAIWGKIGGFRFKSPHREQILLLLLKLIFQNLKIFSGFRNG